MMIKKTLILLFVFLISFNASSFANVITDPPGEQEGDSINQKIDGKKEGYWIIWAHMRNLPDFKPNDKIEEGNYKTNRKIGMWKKYWANGNLKSEIEFINGRASGAFKTFYENGKPEEAGNWVGRYYTKSFTRWHPNGNIAQEKTFNGSGKTDSIVKYYHTNAQIELEYNTTNGVENGTATRYYPNGDIKEIVEYSEDGNVIEGSRQERERVNPAVTLEEDVITVEEEGVEADGVTFDPKDIGEIEDGYHKTYNENKDIYMDGEFKDAKLWSGKHYIYDENGLLERIEVYKDGKYVGNGVL